MAKHLPIAMLIAAYVVLAATYSFIVPLGEGPDEPGHAAYAFFVAREGRLPDQRQNEVPGEGHQPPLFYALAAPAVMWLPQAERQTDLVGNPHFVWAGGNQINAAMHGTRELPPWRGTVLAWHLLRLVAVACGAATVAMTWLAATAIQNPESRIQSSAAWAAMPFLAAALVAFNPQFLFIGGLVSNDALLAALSATALWLCVRVYSGVRVQQIALGVVLGLALLTKQSALVLVPVIMLACVGGHIKQHGWRWRHLVALSPWRVVLLTAAMISGWWYWRNWQLYGDLFGLAEFQQQFTTQAFDFRSLTAWHAALSQLHGSFWARFGWMNVAPPAWVLWLYTALGLVALLGWVTAAGRMRTTRSRQAAIYRVRSAILPLVLAATTFAFVVALAATAGLVAWQGRLLFPALGAIAILLAQGLEHAAFSLRQQSRPLLAALALAALAFWLPFSVIRPAYPVQVLSEQAASTWPGTAAAVRFGQPGEAGVELQAHRVDGAMRPGAALELTLLWHAIGRQGRDWAVFVHVVDEAGQIVAQSNRQPRDGGLPTSQWIPGDWIEDAHAVALPPDLRQGNYMLRVGLFDQHGTLERAGVWDTAGVLIGDYVEIGTVEIMR